MPAWKDYQEEAAEFFRSLGLEAETDFTFEGVRTKHDIDVLVKLHHHGFDITWVVECKYWKEPVSKVHVLALRQIVIEIGADRGILLCEVGFQSGAVEAANLTNVQVTSLANLRVSASAGVDAMRLRELYDRIENCNDRYWEIPKDKRIADGLRPDVGEAAYSGATVIGACRDTLSRALRGMYPFHCEALAGFMYAQFKDEFRSAEQVIAVVEPMITELEGRLTASETKQP
jgi:restriction system protein